MSPELVYAFLLGVLFGLALAWLVIPAMVDAWTAVVRRYAPSQATRRRGR